MKKLAVLLAALLALTFITGCGAKGYVVKMKSGEVYESDGKPDMGAKGDYLPLKDKEGKTIYLNKDEVLAIEEQK